MHFIVCILYKRGNTTNDNHNYFRGWVRGSIYTYSAYTHSVYTQGVCGHTYAYVYNLKIFMHFIVNICYFYILKIINILNEYYCPNEEKLFFTCFFLSYLMFPTFNYITFHLTETKVFFLLAFFSNIYQAAPLQIHHLGALRWHGYVW